MVDHPRASRSPPCPGRAGTSTLGSMANAAPDVVAETQREEEQVDRAERRKQWLRPVGTLALTAGLTLGAAAPAIAQNTPPAGRVDLTGSPVALHDGSCAKPIVEPEFEIGQLEPQEYGEVADDLAEDDLAAGDEDLDNDGVLDEGEDLDGDGVLDGAGTLEGGDEPVDGLAGDVDEDGVADVDEEGYLDEDLDNDDVLDEGEDLNGNGVLDAGIDQDGDGTLGEDEIIPGAGIEADAVVVAIDFPTVWKAEEEVDATFEELFGTEEDVAEEEEDDDALDDPGIIAVHESSENYGNIVACGELGVVDWEDSDDVVVGLRPIKGSGVYGYAVFERDTGNIPIFGENTSGVTTYLFQNLPTLRQERMTPTPPPAPTATPPPPTNTPVPTAVITETEVVPAPTATAAAQQ